jgi:hypothetical protein
LLSPEAVAAAEMRQEEEVRVGIAHPLWESRLVAVLLRNPRCLLHPVQATQLLSGLEEQEMLQQAKEQTATILYLTQ